jgi:hypothetical protein
MDTLENARLTYRKIAAGASSDEYNCVDGSSKNVMVDLKGLEHAKGRPGAHPAEEASTGPASWNLGLTIDGLMNSLICQRNGCHSR